MASPARVCFQIFAVAAAGQQCTLALAVPFLGDMTQALQFGGEFLEHLLAVRTLADLFLGIEAHRVTVSACAFADHHLLHLQILGHRLVAPRAGDYRLSNLVAAAHRHGHQVFAPAFRQGLEIGRRHHPGIAHEQTSRELPALQLFLHLGHCGDVDSIAGEHPVTHRETLARDRHSHHDLRHIPASVLRVAALARGRVGFTAGRPTAVHQVVRAEATVLLIDLKVKRRRFSLITGRSGRSVVPTKSFAYANTSTSEGNSRQYCSTIARRSGFPRKRHPKWRERTLTARSVACCVQYDTCVSRNQFAV